MADPSEPSSDDLQDSLLWFADFLDARRIAYMIVGAMAVAIWGRPRATGDLDVTVALDAAGLEALAEDAAHVGFVVDRHWLEWQPLLRGTHVRLMRGDVIVDAMRPRDLHDEAALSRRRSIAITERTLWFVAPEDLIVMKLKAGRPRDFEDALGVLIAQREVLDQAYVAEWARRVGVADELAYLLAQGDG